MRISRSIIVLMTTLFMASLLSSACSNMLRNRDHLQEYSSEQLNSMGVAYENAGNIKRAITYYEAAVAKNEENYTAWTNLGNVKYVSDRLAEAEKHYRNALKIKPDYVPALNNLANTLIDFERYEEARGLLDSAIAHASFRDERDAVYGSYAKLYQRVGDADQHAYWSSLIEGGSAVLHSVPFFKQERFQCGVSALASIYHYYGLEQTPQVIAERVYDPSNRGTLNLKMLLDIRNQGLEAKIVSGSHELIKESIDRNTPLIAMVELPSGANHYYVIVGYHGHNVSKIVVHDGRKPFQEIDRKVFDGYWRNTAYSTIILH